MNEMTTPTYRVYIKIDENNFITQIEGECSLSNLGGLDQPNVIKIDEGEGDKYNHAQGRYLDKPIMDEMGAYNYKYIDGKVVEATEADKAPFYEAMEKAREEAERNSPQAQIERLSEALDELIMNMV